MENCPITILYGTYLPVAIMVFIIPTIQYLTFVTAGIRDEPDSGSGYVYTIYYIHGFLWGVTSRTKGKTGFCSIGLWYIFKYGRVQYSTVQYLYYLVSFLFGVPAWRLM